MRETKQGLLAGPVLMSVFDESFQNLKGRSLTLDPRPLCSCSQMVPEQTIGTQSGPEMLRICETRL